ncbi:MAG TPA: DUF305 domain-containing protein [Ilumatobacteraceae bacterium]|nr:DUF305 domain-containing protein [Ilumatobacteraceae bacterium]
MSNYQTATGRDPVHAGDDSVLDHTESPRVGPSDHDDDDGGPPDDGTDSDDRMKQMYWRFGAMIATSTVVMFVLMYFNTYEWDHVQWSETRFYMALVMGSTMAVIMLLFMLGMYKSKVVNAAILGTAIVVFASTLWLVRSQTTVQDTSYMRSMIPHHSVAILTSERSELTDLRVLELADEIILAQRREIAEMQWLIDDIQDNGEVRTAAELEGRPIPEFTFTNGRDELSGDG